jgi:hypothetical protein
VLGFLSHEWFDGRADVDGLHLHGPTFDWDNQDSNGNLYPPTLTPDGYLPADLPHLRAEITTQLAQGAMMGFIQAYFGAQANDRSPVPMRFCRPDDIPMTAMLALTSNPDRWRRTLLIVCYDEHGGFFDHVSPPTMRYNAPMGNSWLDPTAMSTLGVRIPGIIVSPAIGEKTSFHELLDHTSIQQLLVDRFGSPGDLARFGVAAQRKANGVASLASLPWLDTPRSDVPPVPPLPSQPPAVATTLPVSNVGLMFRGVMADHPVPGAR